MIWTIILTILVIVGWIGVLELNRRLRESSYNNQELNDELIKCKKLLQNKYSHVKTHLTEKDLNDIKVAFSYYNTLISNISPTSNLGVSLHNQFLEQFYRVEDIVESLEVYHTQKTYLLTDEQVKQMINLLYAIVNDKKMNKIYMIEHADMCLNIIDNAEISDNRQNSEIHAQRDASIESLNKD